jgi:hypothetical protein
MKGPYERLKYDLRRVWECPACGRQGRTSGMATSLVCTCQIDKPLVNQVTMKLVHDGPLRVGADKH